MDVSSRNSKSKYLLLISRLGRMENIQVKNIIKCQKNINLKKKIQKLLKNLILNTNKYFY